MTFSPRYPSVGPHQRDLVDLAAEIRRFTECLNRLNLNGRRLVVEGKQVYAGYENLIEHGLNREVTGWQVVDTTEQALFSRVASPTADVDPKRVLVLRASADTTISLEVW